MPGPLRLVIEPTPDLNVLTLTLNRTVAAKDRGTYEQPAQAEASPLARQLFTVPGIRRLIVEAQVVTVRRELGHRWEAIIPQVKTVLEQYFA